MNATTKGGPPPGPDGEMPTLDRPLPRPPSIGDVIAGKYRLLHTLGRGGMGRIFAAMHLMLDATVALKFMHPHLTLSSVSVGRFVREARAAATLRSPHVARIIDVDELPSGELYIVMEHLDGASLETLARHGRGLSIADAAMYIVHACHALAEAHDRGIVHRDIKPANLFLTKGKSGEPIVKVLDFGLAKSTAVDACTSADAQALGTPRYMSPEQIRGARDIDARTDVWSLGATLYELLSGRPAFEAKGTTAIFTRILKGSAAPLRSLRPDVPPALAAIVDRCLARDPAARFSNVRDVARALSMPVHAVPPAPVVPHVYASTLVSPSDPAQPVAALPSEPHVSWATLPPAEMTSMRPAAMSMPSAASSIAPFAMNVGLAARPDGDGEPEPTLRQTVLAALAGPALIAFAAAVMALVVGVGPAHSSGAARAASASAPRASVAAHLTAKAAPVVTRGKAAATVLPKCARNPRSPSCAGVAGVARIGS